CTRSCTPCCRFSVSCESAGPIFPGTQLPSHCSGSHSFHIFCFGRKWLTAAAMFPGRAARIRALGKRSRPPPGSRRAMVYLTRKAEFAASHYYHNPSFSAEENRRIFGKCNNPNGHGHNYTLEVTVKGEVDARSGFVVDLKQLKEVLNHEVLDALDHRFLNKEVPEFAHAIPTTENLAIAVWRRLEPKLRFAK